MSAKPMPDRQSDLFGGGSGEQSSLPIGGGFYNTPGLNGAELRAARAQALSQEAKILQHFKDHDGQLLSCEDVLKIMPEGTPLTSVRRAITNLTNEGKLLKTAKQKVGMYGVRIHYWTFRWEDQR